MSLGKKAKDAAIELVKQQAARDILAAIDKWRGSRISTANRRWIFELIQNAVDAARARQKERLLIVFDYDGKSLVFRHNAGYFTFAELDSLIYGTSSKPWGPESEYLGRFGTGFLVSHIVSKSVKIDGLVKDDNGDIYRFGLEINREGDDVEKISASIEDCFRQLDNSELVTSGPDTWTTYTYSSLDSLGSTAVPEGIKQLKQNAPLLLAFNPIEEIAIGTDRYTRQNVENLGGITKVTVSSAQVYFINSDEESSVQVAVVCDDKGIIEMANRPSVFIGVPVTESADYIQIPFVINNLKFETTLDRDSLANSQGNAESLKTALDLYFELLVKLLNIEEGRKLLNLFRLVQFQPVPDNQLSQNPLWNNFNVYLNTTFGKIVSDLPLVKTTTGQTTIKNSVFPHPKFDGKEMDSSNFAEFYELVKKMGKTIPDKSELTGWISTAQQLQVSFQNDVTLYSLVDLKEEIGKLVLSGSPLPSFETITKEFGLDDSSRFIHSFYKIVDSLYAAKMIPLDFIKSLLPDQNGVVGPVRRTWTESKISFQLLLEDSQEPLPSELKDIVTKIGKSLGGELINKDYSKFQIVQDYVHETITIDKVISEMITNALYSLPDKISTFEDNKVTGWIELFRWCATKKKLINGFQVITKGLGTLKLDDVNKETLVMPFKTLKIAQKFEEIYPETKILNSIYLDIHKTKRNELLGALQNYGAFVFGLPSHKREMIFPFGKLKSVLYEVGEVSKVDHSILTHNSDSISYLPFWNEVIGRISEFKDRAKLLFSFIMEYLANEDKSWQNNIQVSCSCKEKAHIILPTNWLASLKTDAWVPIKVSENGEEKSVKTSASKESIEGLFEPGEFENIIAADSDLAMNLLPHLNFDKLDLRIKLHSLKIGKLEANVRDDASGLVELVGVVDAADVKEIAQNPVVFQQVVAEMKKTVHDQQLKEENKVVGKNVQMIMRKIVNDAGLGLKAKPIYVGGDMEIWPDNSEGSDDGEIEMLPYTVEVKSTSGIRVHLSRAQSEAAHLKRDNYIVLVVEDTGNLRERLKTVIEEDKIPEDLIALLVERSRVLEEIYSKLGNFPDTDEVEADIHGYWIKRKLWEDKVDLREWIKQKFKPG